MLKKLYTRKLKCTLIGLISLLILGGLGFYIYSTQKADTPLNVLVLNQDADPVFKLDSEVYYSKDLVNLMVSTEGKKQTSPLNLTFLLNDDTALFSDVLCKDLETLLSYNSAIFLSIIADSNMTDTEYIAFCSNLQSSLNDYALNAVHLIWYPVSANALKQYNDQAINYIGFTLNSSADLDNFDKFYHTFKDKKVLFLREQIKAYFGDNPKKGAAEISNCYYRLAINYPSIQTILNPYISNYYTNSTTGKFSLNLSYDEYKAYDKVYTQVLEEPWTTTEEIDVNNTSPYSELKPYTALSGTEEILLSPSSKLIDFINTGETSSTKRICYRLGDGTNITIQAYYPYLISLDTTLLPNGINRLKGLAYGEDNEVHLMHSIDLYIANEITASRAPRKETTYSLSSQPIYTKSYIPILMYHTIADDLTGKSENSSVQTEVFDSQMKALVDSGYTSITFLDLYNYLNGTAGLPEKPIIITMDDGYLNNYTLAYPIYKKYDLSATLFVSPAFMEEENTEDHFGWAAAREMEQSGLIDIESHGYNHTPFTQISLKDVKYHITHSKGLIEQNLGKRDIFTVACPQFRNNIFTRKTLTDLGVDFQITNLADKSTTMHTDNLKRINVPNGMAPEELISTLESLTMK